MISKTHKGSTYYATGKRGNNRLTGAEVVEMEAMDAARIWVDAKSGKVVEENA